jgi:Domain of unknown function (DUF4124)
VLAVDASSPLAKNVAAMPAPRARALRALILAAVCGIALGAQAAVAEDTPAAAAAPTIYKWVDTNGIAHYTTELGRVPRSVRGSVRALGNAGGTPGDGFAARDASPEAPPDSAAPSAAPGTAPGTEQTDWDQGSAGAAAAATTPAAGDAGDPFAETDRPAELPGDEGQAAAPPQTASAEPAAAVAAEIDPARAGELDARIAALEAEIASDEEALKGFLAAPAPGDPGQIAYDPSFREVAERLPKRLAELRTLESERAQLDQP